MQLSDNVSKNIVQIFHNAKFSFLSDILKETNQYNETSNNNLTSPIYQAAKRRNIEEDTSSIFQHQPTSEYTQQPIPSSEGNEHVSSDEVENERKNKEQLTDEERKTLENKDRQEDIEEQRADYEGFLGEQR